MKIPKSLLFPKNIEELEFSKATSLTRIFLGLILLHKFIDLYFSSSVPFDESFISLIGIFSSIFTSIGFLTPIFLPLLSLLNWITSRNLAGQIVAILTILLFLSHSWKHNSIDNLLRENFKIISTILKKIEILYIRTHILRTFAIWLWGGICFAAMAFHFTDPSWINGTAVLTLLRTPYLNDFYELFNNLNDNLLLFLSKISLYGMAIFELFLWAFPGIKIIRSVTFWWGIIFFASSILFINLSYLPYLEILMWVLIYKPNYFLVNKKLFNKNWGEINSNKFVEYPIIFLGLFSVLYMSISTTLNIHANSKKVRDIGYKMIYHFIPRTVAGKIFGQYPVNVFNQDDLMMNKYSIMICRNYETGFKKLVPFQDLNGGRLSYLANDNFYFSNSLPWQRWSRNLEPDDIYESWLILSNKVISYDYHLNKRSKIISYDIYLLEHHPNYLNKNILAGWNKNKKAKIIFSKKIKNKEIKKYQTIRLSIPPGHFNEKTRIENTEKDFC